ncbi:MAG TPA: CPBP family intramembrane metalloprotease [Acholeplasmataceae bacterium]|nr:CPBP family intramembrane metalloprotease [Acholeplasmataceae bacterium]HRX44708.1 CPBP family intramembrane metalloprotease [Acholeplasmataceae bacterium]
MKQKIELKLSQQITLLFLVAFVIILELVDFGFLGHETDVHMIIDTFKRLGIGTIFIMVLYFLGYRDMFKFNQAGKSLLVMLPAFLISINNFPISAFLQGRTELNEPVYRIFLFFIECLSIGFFEEILFRGILLFVLLDIFSNRKYGVLLAIVFSSLIFGSLHILNVFEGASMNVIIEQIGYSFLMGMLWAVMYLKTKNVWLVMLLHATYNFFGQVMFELGTVNNRFDTVTVVITIILAIGVAVYSVLLLKGMKQDQSVNSHGIM